MNDKQYRRLWRKIKKYAQARVNDSWAGSYPDEDAEEIRDDLATAKQDLDKELKSMVQEEIGHDVEVNVDELRKAFKEHA